MEGSEQAAKKEKRTGKGPTFRPSSGGGAHEVAVSHRNAKQGLPENWKNAREQLLVPAATITLDFAQVQMTIDTFYVVHAGDHPGSG